MLALVHLRDSRGNLEYDARNGVPLTITVTDEPSAVPAGIGVRISMPPRFRRPPETDLDFVLGHVADWSGFHYYGREIACARNWVRAVLTVHPHFVIQLRRQLAEMGLTREEAARTKPRPAEVSHG